MPDFRCLKEKGRIFLDHNATTPLAQCVMDKLLEWAKVWGNPSSIHQTGRAPKALLREARNAVGDFIGSHPLEVAFTSGGSESNNWALKGGYWTQKAKDPRRQEVIVSAVEHPSVMKAAKFLEDQGAKIIKVPVSREGVMDLDFYESALNEKTALVSIMYANNETGHIFPIPSMVKKAHEVGALFHCDGVQALGKVTVNVQSWGVDMASFSAHKCYSLKGCGVLYIRKGLVVESLIHGGGQERRRRAGTENTLGIASFGEVAKNYKDQVSSFYEKVLALRKRLEEGLKEFVDGVEIIGENQKRVPNTVGVILPSGVYGESVLMNLDIEGFSVSTGSACSSGSSEPSATLTAMGFSRQEAERSLRISLGWGSTEEDIQEFIIALAKIIRRLKSL
ncbi:MAG: cysteine desulfurase [Bdellovibrio sp.]|nr:MAG: cysteine desulfurase [Bdellovibrio sp.]